eukprot:4645574-Pyramimonas_sp.AAC.1
MSKLKQQRVAARGPQTEVSFLGVRLGHARTKRVQLLAELTERCARGPEAGRGGGGAALDHEPVITQGTTTIAELEASLNATSHAVGRPSAVGRDSAMPSVFLATVPEAANIGPGK